MSMTKGPELLKVWDNFEAGIGFPVEDGTPGMYSASKILGLRGELRPAPAAVQVAMDNDRGQHYQYFLEEPGTAGSVPTFDAGASGTCDGATTITWSHTVSAVKDNQLLLVGVLSDATGADAPASSVTYGGVAMLITKGTSPLHTAYGTCALDIYYLVEPPTGANNVVVTLSEATDACGISSSWYNVDTSSPMSAAEEAKGQDNTVTVDVGSGSIDKAREVVVDFAMCTNTVQTMTIGADQTNVLGGGVTALQDDVRAASSYETGAAPNTMSWGLGGAADWVTRAVAIMGARPGPGYLYAERGKKGGSNLSVKLDKISLGNIDFGTADTTYYHDLTPLTKCGQPVRYQGKWWFPMGNNQSAWRLTAIGVGLGSTAGDIDVDTELDTVTDKLGADHFANLGFQVIATLAHSDEDDGGVRILKKDGEVNTEAHWGSPFQVGDRNERAGGVAGLSGMAFALNVEGLYSFNQTGRSGLVFEDFRMWRHVFDNMPIKPYRGGLIISHPTGLIYYIPGQPPLNIGLDANKLAATVTPPGPTDLFGGRYHGTAVAGDIIYTIYQPDLSSTAALVLAGYPGGQGFLWQGLGTTVLADIDHMLGCFVSVSSKPSSAQYVTPTLWYGNDDDLDYKVLSTNGSPFRPRADTHVVETSGDVYLSELTFPTPHKLSHFVVYTEDMASGDEWQMSGIPNAGADTNAGAPVLADERAERFLGLTDVRRFMPHINWTATSSSARVPPTIKRIELWGQPE